MILTLLTAIIGLLISAGIVKLGYLYFSSYRILLQSKCFRGPKPLPFIGNTNFFTESATDIYREMEKATHKYQSPFRIWVGPTLYFCIQEPEHVKLILNNPSAIGKPPIYDFLKPLAGDGLVTARVSKWIPHRKAIEPLFSRKVLESFIEMLESEASIMVEKIGMEGEEIEIDVQHYMGRYTFQTICGTVVGTSMNISYENTSSLFHMIQSGLTIVSSRIRRPWLYPDFIFKHTYMGQRLYKAIEYNRNFLKKCLTNKKHDIGKALATEPRKSLLGLLLTSSEVAYKFTDDEILDELITILGTGYETTATALSLVLFMLASYPDVQDKVYAEVYETYGVCKSNGSDITMEDLNRMEYLNRVLKETIRLFPIAPELARCISEDITIGEYTLPAGSSVLINVLAIHRSEKYWSRPLEFIPDRFLPRHPLGPRHPCAYIPFSIGPRNCIGGKYAILSMKMFVATLVWKYIIKTTMSQEPKDLEFHRSIVMHTKCPIMISVQRRFPEMS